MTPLTLPIWQRLENAQSVLIAGAGGGFDIFSGLPLFFALRSAGKTVHLANLSFSHLDAATGKRLSPAHLEVNVRSRIMVPYFPEYFLSCWFFEHGEDVSIHCFERVGVKPLREAYSALVKEHSIDTIILVDGGTDSLMRGDEAGLGTPEEDMTSIAAVHRVVVPRKFLVCLGFGVDSFHGVCHGHALEAIAELARQDAYLGAFSLVASMPEVAKFMEASDYVCSAMPHHPSIVCGSVLSALEGHYGDHHRTHRTHGSTLWINPLMAFYWCFELNAIAKRILYLDLLEPTVTCWDVMSAIDYFRGSHRPIRERTAIPDVSLGRTTSR